MSWSNGGYFYGLLVHKRAAATTLVANACDCYVLKYFVALLAADGAEFKAGVASLAKLLQLPVHTDQVMVFQVRIKLKNS